MNITDKLITIAENEQRVYDAGYTAGRNIMIERKLKEIDDDKLTVVNAYAFIATELKKCNLPNVEQVGKYAFSGCNLLTEVNMPKLSSYTQDGSDNVFAQCSSATSYNLPKLPSVGYHMFWSNRALTEIRLKRPYSIAREAFIGCSSLTKFIIEEYGYCRLESNNAFAETPIQTGEGYIYVPDEHVERYKSATNWVYYKTKIKGISELSEE